MADGISVVKKRTAEAPTRPRKVNECMMDAKRLLPPGMLFDEFWREGELALMFGASGTGKSILAVQVVDAVARGRGIDGFRMIGRQQKVLYVDLLLSESQFTARYSNIGAGGEWGKSYKFSENLYRDRPPAGKELYEWLREKLRENGFRVVVIDDLSAIRQTCDGTRETLSLMRKLRQLTLETGISVLVLSGSREPRRNSLVSEADMQRSRVLCDAADSVFALARHASRPDDRYFIQTRSRSAAICWHSGNAPACRITRTDGGFLAFGFDERFVAEIDEEERQLICNVKWSHDRGATYRLIAEDFGISKSKVQRLYRKWTPAMEKGLVFEKNEEDIDLDGDYDFEEEVPEDEDTSEIVNEYYFPGREEYDAAGSDPQFAGIYGREDEEAYMLRREAYLIELATANARKEYLKTGIAPPLAEMLARISSESVDGRQESGDRSQELGDWSQEPGEPAYASGSDTAADLRGLKRSYDNNLREIFIESENERGKPIVWYRFNRKAILIRCERNGGSGILTQPVDGPICLFNTA